MGSTSDAVGAKPSVCYIRNSGMSVVKLKMLECIEVYGGTIQTFRIVRYIAGSYMSAVEGCPLYS